MNIALRKRALSLVSLILENSSKRSCFEKLAVVSLLWGSAIYSNSGSR